jgi:hypothetical protein
MLQLDGRFAQIEHFEVDAMGTSFGLGSPQVL